MRIILLLLLFGITKLNAQPDLPRAKDGMVTYDGIVELEGMPKGLLYANAKYWFDTYYKSPRVIQSEDSMEGVIHAKSMFKIYKSPGSTVLAGVINYSLHLIIVEGKYKYSVSNLRHTDKTEKIGSGGKLERIEPLCGYKEKKEDQWNLIKSSADEGVKKIIDDLYIGMSIKE